MARAGRSGRATAVTWPQVHAFRMSRHHLDRPAPKAQIPRVVGNVCGVQAQVMAAAQLALRARIRGLTLEDIERALWQDRTLARVWCMRGTVHLVPSNEFAVFVRGASTRQEARIAAWMGRAGASTRSAEQLLEAAGAAMDRPRSRGEIARLIHASVGWPIEKRGSRGWGSPADAAGFRLGTAVVTIPDLAFIASYRGLACFGPDDGQGTTFVRPDAWLQGWRDLPLGDAEETLLRHYLGAFGPATASDFAAWSILTVRHAREIWGRIEDDLAPVDLEGREAWTLRKDLRTLEEAPLDRRVVRLLPYFDSFLMGHRERGHLVDRAHYRRIYRPSGWVYPAVLANGRIEGEWAHERTARHLRIRVRPYRPMDAGTKDGVRAEAEDVARFLGFEEARVTFTRA